MKPKHEPLRFEYSKITAFIYIGTNLCCQTHFEKTLLRQRIQADISLEYNKLDQPLGATYYCWLPTPDHYSPSLKQLKVGVNFLQSLVKNGIKTYVHCQRGHGRAPTVVAAYLISHGKSVEEAIQFIKKRRPSVHLSQKQISALHKFTKTCRN